MISVIVPIYNAEKYLRKCLDSIVNQTYDNIEIILIDDGSTDQSGSICDEYAACDFRIVVIHQMNRGLSAARNVGLDLANGEYITFVDSDDYIELDTYEDVAAAIRQFDPDLTFFREKSVDEAGKTLYINGSEPTGKIELFGKEKAEELVISRLINGMCDKVYKASVLRDIRFQEGKIHGEDFMYNLVAITKVNRVAYIDRIKYSYVSNSTSITHRNFNPSSFDQIYFKDVIADFISHNFPNYTAFAVKLSFLSRLRVMRAIYSEDLQLKYSTEIQKITSEMQQSYPSCKDALSSKEMIEYLLFSRSKVLFCIFSKIVQLRKM